MIELLKHSGICGMLAIVLSFPLLCGVLLFAALAKSRRGLVFIAMACCLPLLVGLAGTALGYANIREWAAEAPRWQEDRSQVIARGQQEARYPSWIGLTSSTMLVALCAAVGATKSTAAT